MVMHDQRTEPNLIFFFEQIQIYFLKELQSNLLPILFMNNKVGSGLEAEIWGLEKNFL